MTRWEELAGAAPPALLRARPIADAEEVLVLTYTCDLSFFEDVCLNEAQAVRARTTVLFDAGQLTEGPRRSDYLAVPVVCKQGGAFHPKLVVIAARTDAVVAIGSGNATASGWHHNAEVWTLLRADGPTVPQLFHDLADWLRRLPDAVSIEERGRESLERVADLLRDRPAETQPDQPTLVTTAVRPIVEQLPVPGDRVTSLAVAAPFFDPRAVALDRLVDRFSPAELHLLLTRDVQCEPDALAEATKRPSAAMTTTPDSSRYHHAKIVEWATADRWWALTGSANCSIAALTRTMATGGNCELGLLSPLADSLVGHVSAHPIDLADPVGLHPREPGPYPSEVPALRVLGVRIGPDRVEVTVLVREGPAPSWLEVAGLRLDHLSVEDSLHGYGAVLPSDWVVPTNGTATVLVTTDSGAEFHDVIMTDLVAALSRIDRPSPLEHSALPPVLANAAHAAALFDAIGYLASVRPDQITAPSGPARRRQVESRISTAVGPALMRFTLGLDDPGRPAPVDDNDLFEETERPGAGVTPLPPREGPPKVTTTPRTRPETVATVLDALTEGQRVRLRRDVGLLVNAAEEWPLPAKLAMGRLVLLLLAGGLWTEPEDWSQLLCGVVLQLWLTDQDECLDGEHAALATVGLVALRHGIDLCDEPDDQMVEDFEELRLAYRDWDDWLSAAPLDTVRRYVTGLNGHTLGLLFERTPFTTELRWILGRSALHDAVDKHAGARVDGISTVRVSGGRNTRQAVIGALDALRDFPDTHVISDGAPEVHGWWDGRRLLLVSRSGTSWRAELWPRLMTGIAAYSRGRPLPAPSRRWAAASPREALRTVVAQP